MRRALLLLIGLLAGCNSAAKTPGDIPPPNNDPPRTTKEWVEHDEQSALQLMDDARNQAPYTEADRQAARTYRPAH